MHSPCALKVSTCSISKTTSVVHSPPWCAPTPGALSSTPISCSTPSSSSMSSEVPNFPLLPKVDLEVLASIMDLATSIPPCLLAVVAECSNSQYFYTFFQYTVHRLFSLRRSLLTQETPAFCAQQSQEYAFTTRTLFKITRFVAYSTFFQANFNALLWKSFHKSYICRYKISQSRIQAIRCSEVLSPQVPPFAEHAPYI